MVNSSSRPAALLLFSLLVCSLAAAASKLEISEADIHVDIRDSVLRIALPINSSFRVEIPAKLHLSLLNPSGAIDAENSSDSRIAPGRHLIHVEVPIAFDDSSTDHL